MSSTSLRLCKSRENEKLKLWITDFRKKTRSPETDVAYSHIPFVYSGESVCCLSIVNFCYGLNSCRMLSSPSSLITDRHDMCNHQEGIEEYAIDA